MGLESNVQPLGLAINSSVSGTMMNIDVKVGFDLNTSGAKLVVYVVEDALVYPQVNYYDADSSSPWFGMGNPIPGFVHDDVARAALTDVFGDAIPASDAVAGGEYVKNFSVAVPSNVANASNVKIVAFVVDSQGNSMNVQEVHLGSNQDYQ